MGVLYALDWGLHFAVYKRAVLELLKGSRVSSVLFQ
jgi:hypothetical protein